MIMEMYQFLNPLINYDESTMQKNAMKLVELNKFRREEDNISVALIKAC